MGIPLGVAIWWRWVTNLMYTELALCQLSSSLGSSRFSMFAAPSAGTLCPHLIDPATDSRHFLRSLPSALRLTLCPARCFYTYFFVISIFSYFFEQPIL